MVLIFFIQSKKSRRRTASEKGKNVQYNKNKISSDFLTSFVTYTCKCFIHHTIIILFLLSEFLAIILHLPQQLEEEVQELEQDVSELNKQQASTPFPRNTIKDSFIR